ncbi:MAG TPA: PASTA domain-containing protein [Acidimicrobiales bacterium]|nr:PASTA domain-containing protein [Acidimicrobiales bacterium]
MIDEQSRLATPELAQRIADRYTLRGWLASGECTDVYLADDAERTGEVAVKVLRTSAGPMSVECFRREAEISSSLTHPNIVTAFDSGTDSGHDYLAMEYVAGGTLSSLIGSTWAASHLDPDEVARIGGDIARALDYLHGRGYIHQGLNPSNVLVDPEGRPKLIDFGAAASAAGDEPVASPSAPNASYLAPELTMGQRASVRSDQYALGVILYEMATGRPPFVGGSPALIAHKHVQEAVIPPTWMNGAIPSSLEGIILRALSKDPARRYGSAGEMAADLDRFRNEVAGSADERASGASVASAGASALLGGGDRTPRPAAVTAPANRSLLLNTGGAPDLAPKSRSTSSVSGTLYPPRQRRRPSAALSIGMSLLVGLIGVYVGRSLGAASVSKHATVPKVTGLSATDATGQLRLLGLKVATRARPAAANEVGDVLSQSPAGDKGVARGTTVTITVGIAQTIAVPDVENLTVDVARRDLVAKGLRVAVKNVAASSPSQPNGLVLRQTPSPKFLAQAGSAITLSVVLVNKVGVPSTSGLNLSEAAVLLQQSGLKVAPKFANLNSSTVPSGSIVRSLPASGSKVAKGSAVQLFISEGPAVTPGTVVTTPVIVVPSVVGAKVQRAASEVKAAGLSYRVLQEATGNPALNGIVAKTSPRSGRSVAAGGVVVMSVWIYSSVNAVAAPTTQNVPANNP